MSANFQNLSPQQIQQLQQQAVTTQLQAPLQYGTDKLLINVNGQNSKLPTNKNGIVKYTLEQPIKLEIGDKITLVESFVEERGLSVDTISFEEDVEEEIRFLYYIQGDCRNTQGDNSKGGLLYSDTVCADQEFTCFPNVFPDFYNPIVDGNNTINPSFMDNSGVIQQGYLFPNRNYSSLAPSTDASSVGTVNEKISGANGQYYYMCEYFSPQQGSTNNNEPDQRKWRIKFDNEILSGQPAQACFFRPFYGAVKIKIPAGNYSVSALSDLINNQMNGTSIPSNESVDKLTNKLYVEENTEASTLINPFFKNLNQISDYDNTEITPSEYNPDVDIIGPDTYQPYQRRRGNILTECKFNSALTANRINLETMRDIPLIIPQLGGGETMPTWFNQFPIAENSDGSGYPANEQPLYTGGVLSGSDVNGETQGFQGVSNDFLFRQQANNFFLHLDGFKHIFDDGTYNGVNQYYNKNTFNESDDMKTGKWNQKFFPTLFDIFSMNISTGGLITFDQNLRNYNFESYPAEEPKQIQDRVYINNFLNSSDQGQSIENLKFQCMFPVRASGDNLNITQIGELPRIIGSFQQFAGTTSFQLKYDTESANRFSILNLHEPYKLANKDPTNQSDTNVGGQQGTIFNSPLSYFDDPNNPNSRSVGPVTNPKIGVYPIDSAGGIAVNNFAFNAVKNTTIYKEAISRIQSLNTSNIDYQLAREKEIYSLFTKPFEKFFQSEADAKEAWASTFWNRLGFTYDQLGNITNNLESIYSFSNNNQNIFTGRYPVTQPRFIKQMGIITHNAFDYTFIPSTSGLGSGNPYSGIVGKTGVPQGYGLRAYTAGAPFGNFANQEGLVQNYINVLANSYPINAFNFPSLNNGNNYLVIESDIVKTNAKDSNSNSTTIVGIMSKQNATNDTIFSVSPTTFINTEPRLLSTIEVRIKNPDGTLVSDDVVGQNNGFVFQIEKAIKVAEIAGQSF